MVITFFDVNETNVLQGVVLNVNITINNGTNAHESIGFEINGTLGNRTNTYFNDSNSLLFFTETLEGNYSIMAWANDTSNNLNWSNTTAASDIWVNIFTTTTTTTLGARSGLTIVGGNVGLNIFSGLVIW